MLHMCRRHWAMVPKPFQRALWLNYRQGQEKDKNPSAEYLRAAADCIGSVARAEGWPDEEIANELDGYYAWAEMLEADLTETV